MRNNLVIDNFPRENEYFFPATLTDEILKTICDRHLMPCEKYVTNHQIARCHNYTSNHHRKSNPLKFK